MYVVASVVSDDNNKINYVKNYHNQKFVNLNTLFLTECLVVKLYIFLKIACALTFVAY